MWSPMYEVLVGPSAALVGGFMFPFLAGECDLLWASGVEGAVLLAEAVLEEDLKRLRLRCWLKCGRGIVGPIVHVSEPGAALFCVRLLAIEARQAGRQSW